MTMPILGPLATMVKDAVAAIAPTSPALTPSAPKKTPVLPSLRDLERQRSLDDEREWEESINAGSEPRRWIDRRRVRRWLDRR
jgi:hypothetical protein